MLALPLLIVLAVFGAFALQIDDWNRDLTTNYAATSIDATDELLRTLQVSASPEEVHQAIRDFSDQSTAWEIVDITGDPPGWVELTRTTPLFRFVDDIRVVCSPIEAGTQVDITSQSRVGKGDLGQNPRNIRMLRKALLEKLPTATEPSTTNDG